MGKFRMKINEWLENSDSILALMLYNAGAWFDNKIGYPLYSLSYWWIQDFTICHYLTKAMNKVKAMNEKAMKEVSPNTIKIYSWRRLWWPVTIEITKAPPFGDVVMMGVDVLKINNDWQMVRSADYCWVYILKNNNIYIVDKMGDGENRKIFAIGERISEKESEVT